MSCKFILFIVHLPWTFEAPVTSARMCPYRLSKPIFSLKLPEFFRETYIGSTAFQHINLSAETFVNHERQFLQLPQFLTIWGIVARICHPQVTRIKNTWQTSSFCALPHDPHSGRLQRATFAWLSCDQDSRMHVLTALHRNGQICTSGCERALRRQYLGDCHGLKDANITHSQKNENPVVTVAF